MNRKVLVNKDKGATVVILESKKYRGKGIARCNSNEGDKFDAVLGENLASSRAKLSYQKAQRRSYLNKIDSLEKQAAMFRKMVAQVEGQMGQTSSEIDALLVGV